MSRLLLGVLAGWLVREHTPALTEYLRRCPVCAERRRTDMHRHPSVRAVPEQGR